MRVSIRCGGVLLLSSLLISAQTAPAPLPAASERKLLDQYCVTCHNQRLKTANLTLDKLDPANVAAQPESWEKVVRKLRAGMMPPSASRGPPPRLRGTSFARKMIWTAPPPLLNSRALLFTA